MKHSASKASDAHIFWRAAADRSRELLGPNHKTTVFCQNNIGQALVDSEFYDEAIPLLETALRQAQALYGYVSFSVEHVCQSLARAYRAKGNLTMAHKHWLSAAMSSESLRGLLHDTTIFCYHRAARALASDKRFQEALPLFQKVMQANFELHGNTIHTAFAERDLATCLNQLGHHKESVHHWRRSHRIFKADPTKAIVSKDTLRCLMWTRRKIRAERKLEQSQVVAAIEGLSDEDRAYLVTLQLTNKQLAAVLAHIEATYLARENGQYHEFGNLRVALKSRTKQMAAYQARVKEGCCSSQDAELEVVEADGNRDTVLVGFNFCH